MSFHDKTAKEVMLELKTSESGLSMQEAEHRLKTYGPNLLREKSRDGALKLLLNQFASPIVWVLLAAMIVSFVVDEITDASVIGAILVINTILGFIQEYRAENAIAALKKLTALKAKVIREGREMLISAELLVPGDIILLETGDKVPADARLLESVNLHTLESALTGESTPVGKKIEAAGFNAQVADRIDMVHSGTIVTAGRCTAIVTGTGNETEIGKIAKLIEDAEQEATPLQKKLARLSVALTIIVMTVAGVVFALGVIQNQPLFTFFLAAIALAVAAIPEGLPAIVTMALAIGVQRMAARNALIRKLPSAETLGSCSVICSDKTGTLTHNQMTVRKLYVDGTVVTLDGAGYAPTGRFSAKPKDLAVLLAIGALNNNSKVEPQGKDWAVFGDPTEGALIVSARKAGIEASKLAMPRVDEIEFTSERKLMTTIHRRGAKTASYVKGAPDVILSKCSRIIINGKARKLTADDRKAITKTNESFAKDALRVLGFAYKDGSKDPEKDLIFVGLQAMIDPPRAEVKAAIAECQSAGIKVVMITGDHLITAQAIAKELGITGEAVTGAELEKMKSFDPEKIGIYARVNPEHKIRIVEALQKKGHVTAMTGDGVNDAPALKKADIGIAMGIAGTDVAKEASAMVLADDNFATIVAAVKEGRRIYDNILQFIEYLLSSNIGEVLTIFVALLLGMPLPITPIQLLWINLVTDGFPALALGVEPAAKDIMRRPPRNAKEPILNRSRLLEILLIGLLMMAGTLFIFTQYGSTMAFTTLVLFQLFNVLNQRSEHLSIFQMPLFSNPWLWLAIASSLALQFVVLYTPLALVFGTEALTLIQWGWCVGVSGSVLVLGELIKLTRRVFE